MELTDNNKHSKIHNIWRKESIIHSPSTSILKSACQSYT